MQKNLMLPFNESFPCIRIKQPIGEFYIASIKSKILRDITFTDVRRIEGERGFETYLGIQRPLKENRVKEIQKYVESPDACFPTAVILSIRGVCAEFDEKTATMTLSSYEDEEDPNNNIHSNSIAQVIDGQHRIEGLRNYVRDDFEVNVSIFIDIDVAEQAHLFSTVNLAQTKVNKSLVYDLFDLAKARSPQKTCHNIAVTLDKHESSPFYQKIKRLGTSTEGRFNETITQATFVEALMKYISQDPISDRNLYMNKKKPSLETNRKTLESYIFRNMFIDEKDIDITDVIWNYFDAVKTRWPKAWEFNGRGLILNKTNGFKALMRFLKSAYLNIGSPGTVPTKEDFLSVLTKIDMQDNDFNTDSFKPGSSGESNLYKELLQKSNIQQ